MRNRLVGILAQLVSSLGNFLVPLGAVRLGTVDDLATTGLILLSYRITVSACRVGIVEPYAKSQDVFAGVVKRVTIESLMVSTVAFVATALLLMSNQGGSALVVAAVILVTVPTESLRYLLQIEGKSRSNLMLDIAWTALTATYLLPIWGDTLTPWLLTWAVGAFVSLIGFSVARMRTDFATSGNLSVVPARPRIGNVSMAMTDRIGFQGTMLLAANLSPVRAFASISASRDVLGVFNPIVHYLSAAAFGAEASARKKVKVVGSVIVAVVTGSILTGSTVQWLSNGALGTTLFGVNADLVGEQAVVVALAIGVFQSTQIVGALTRSQRSRANRGEMLVGLLMVSTVAALLRSDVFQLPSVVLFASVVSLTIAMKRLKSLS